MSQPQFSGLGNEWHMDSIYFDRKRKDYLNHEITHYLISDCTAMTEFNSSAFDFEWDGDDLVDLMKWINFNINSLPVIPKKIEPNKFITFQEHLHRASIAKHHEFRYTFRVTESDTFQGLHSDRSVIDTSFTYMTQAGNYQSTPSLRLMDDKVIIFLD